VISGPGNQDAAGVAGAITAFGGWVPSDLRRFLPLAVFLTCLAEMVLLPTRFFFASAISILLSEDAEDTGGAYHVARRSHYDGLLRPDRRKPEPAWHQRFPTRSVISA
jgi:hypothetical protein